MKKETWNKWIPDKNLCKKYYVDEVCDKDDLSIYLSDDQGKNRIVVRWDCIVESYICSEEVNRSRNSYNHPEIMEWTFFEIFHSKYVQWLTEESYHILSDKGMHHICIVGANSVVDVVASEYPKVEYVQEKEG